LPKYLKKGMIFCAARAIMVFELILTALSGGFMRPDRFCPDFNRLCLTAVSLFLVITSLYAQPAMAADPAPVEPVAAQQVADQTPADAPPVSATEEAPAYPPQPAVVESQSKGSGIEILPAKSINMEEFQIDPDYQTHPPIRLTPDKSELVRLDREAMTIIVGNPLHLSVLADNPKTLIMVGRAPGATHFMALDAKGEVIMQRHAIVASPKEKYVRIRSSCATSGNANCQTTRVYYCPDMCHEVLIDSQTAGGAQPGLPSATPEQAAAAAEQVDAAASGSTSSEEIP
jgi:hypothetical protein